MSDLNETAVPSILETLKEIARENRPIELYNTFHGLLIESPAQILSLDRQRICLKMEGFQAACVYLEKRVLIQAPGLPTAVEGYLNSIHIPEKTAWIDQLTLSPTRLNRRKNQRVQPDGPVQVVIRRSGREIFGQLADLSSEGIGIFTFGTTVEPDTELRAGDALELSLVMPIIDQPIDVTGWVTYVAQEEVPSLKRIGVCSSIDSPLNYSLLDYLSIRQAEILRELEMIYDRLLAGD